MFIIIQLLLIFSFLISLVSLDGVTHHAFDTWLIHSVSNYQLSTYPYFINQWYNDLTFGYFSAGSIFTIPLFLLIFDISSHYQKDREKHLLFLEILKITALTIIVLYTLGYLIDDVATILQRLYPLNQFLGHFVIFIFTACIGCLFILQKFTTPIN